MFRATLALAVVAVVAAAAVVLALPAPLAAAVAGLLVLAVVWPARAPAARPAPLTAPAPPPPDAVLAAVREPMLLVERDRVVQANGAALALLGAHIVGEDVRLALRHPAAADLLGREDSTGAVELTGLGGRDQRLRLELATVAPGRRLLHLIDRTEARAAERARTDFVANASHELRTPLSAIIGFIETLRDDGAADDRALRGRFLEVMDKEARRMARLVDDLLSLSRIEAERGTPLAAAVDLVPVVREVTDEFNDAERCAVAVTLPPDPLPVAGDRVQLSQLVHNLVDNACKYGGGSATATLDNEHGLVRLVIADTGDGIAAQHLQRLTERFYRVDSSRSRAVGGTGLGLAIVKHIVERHRGRLQIDSELGVGTRVSVLLPSAPKPAVTDLSHS